MADSVEWGEGEGVGTDGRGGSAAGLLSSMCALVVLSVGSCYVWVVCCHCLREAHHRPWVRVISWGCWVVVLFMGSGHWLGVLGGGSIRGWSSSFVGVGRCSQALGCQWAHSRGQVACGCWFVIHVHGGDVSSAVWSSLVRPEGTRVGVLTTDDSIDNNNER